MNPLRYRRAGSAAEAIGMCGQPGERLLGGGTNLVDLMRKGVEHPSGLVDVSGLSDQIAPTAEGGLSIGGAARNSAVAAHPSVRAGYPMLARAILAGASEQVRNLATVGGNLMQRTRCLYFADVAGSRCNRRAPGSGCDAIGGFNRYHAIVGASPSCIATHPSDMCVALVALDARVHLQGPAGARSVPLAEFHRLPGDTPEVETCLRPEEIIVSVELPPSPFAQRSAYRKVRDRASYAFALVSVAAGLTLRNGRIDDIRIAFGGVAPKPWRAHGAEAALRGQAPDLAAFAAAAAAEFAEADPPAGAAFKPEMARRTLRAVLGDLCGVAS